MPTQKLQPSRAIQVILSDYADIPSPNVLITGTTTGATTNGLPDTSVEFFVSSESEATSSVNNVEYKVNVGDIVYYPAGQRAGTIIEVVDEHNLLLNYDVFNGDDFVDYIIYQAGPQTGLGNQGCVLYVGVGGKLLVTTSGQDEVTFENIPNGTFLPVNVVSAKSSITTASSIIALW